MYCFVAMAFPVNTFTSFPWLHAGLLRHVGAIRPANSDQAWQQLLERCFYATFSLALALALALGIYGLVIAVLSFQSNKIVYYWLLVFVIARLSLKNVVRSPHRDSFHFFWEVTSILDYVLSAYIRLIEVGHSTTKMTIII